MGEAGVKEAGHVTGTMDKDYDLIWFVESCLNNALRLETYRQDAERAHDTDLAELFGKAQSDSRKGAEMGKRLLAARFAHQTAGTPGVVPAAGVPADEPHVDAMAPRGMTGDEPHPDVMAPSPATDPRERGIE
jgi:hypothetical protein